MAIALASTLHGRDFQVFWQVHRHHPEGPDPLVYGRTMVGEPELTEGAAVHMLVNHQAGQPIFSVVTYE